VLSTDQAGNAQRHLGTADPENTRVQADFVSVK
jgi:hypothetical protein